MGFDVSRSTVTIWVSSPSFSRPEIWIDDLLAQFRYSESNRSWRLYSPARGKRWFHHSWVNPARRLPTLLRELDRDPHEIFWSGPLAQYRQGTRRGSRAAAKVLHLPHRFGSIHE